MEVLVAFEAILSTLKLPKNLTSQIFLDERFQRIIPVECSYGHLFR